ncbi:MULTISPECIES: hypothetical protein [Alphaproteobacteria]|nr:MULTISPECIES: hypothetical protein [Alphaproteobacteria]
MTIFADRSHFYCECFTSMNRRWQHFDQVLMEDIMDEAERLVGR